MPKLSSEEQKKQELYRDARTTDKYDQIWQSVNKCVFCDLNEKYVFFEEHGIVMTISLYAYIDGHFMIVPRRHIRSSKELTQLEWDTIRKFTYIAKKIIKKVHGCKGMQIVQKDGVEAQSTVEHIHFHCIPFDSPDLSVWNYRKLKYTPLQNVALYKKAAKTIINSDLRFERKYQNYSTLPLVCDIVIVNDKNQILFQDRAKGSKLIPASLTMPGGVVQNFDVPFVDELAREVLEEIGVKLHTPDIQLMLSRTGGISYEKFSKPLDVSYKLDNRFIWNTYLLKDFSSKTKLKPGDDCAELVWIDRNKIHNHPSISAGLKAAINEINL